MISFLNPYWFLNIKSLFSKYSDIWLKITFSNIFDIEDNMDIGLYFEKSLSLYIFLNNDKTFKIFSESGNIPVFSI